MNQLPENRRFTSPYRWVIVTLCSLSAIMVIAIPTMSLSVLFATIAADLDISVTQVGLIWGTSSFTGLLLGLLGGVLGDRFGARRLIIIACIGVGLFGASRGLATNFTTFILSSFALGLFAPLIGVNLHSVVSHWFTSDQLGLANGIISAGFAGGFLLGALLAATTIAPALGGWRPVFFLYGVLAFLIAAAWWFLYPDDGVTQNKNQTHAHIPLREGLPKVLRVRAIWLVGIGKIGVWGCVRGFTGYLPLYLRNIGWEPGLADAALSAFFVVSLLGAIPIPMLSDRLQTRRPFLLLAALFIGTGAIMTGFTTTGLVFFASMMAGVLFDAFMGISITVASEIKELGPTLTGTAVGIIFFLSDIGGTVAPPLGNALATISPELPFFLWGGMALLALIPFSMLKKSTP